MIDFEHSAAFTPFMQHTASFSGKRLETGSVVSRDALHAVPCNVLGPTTGDSNSANGAPLDSVEFDVIVNRSEWPDHKPPQSGDVLTIADYPLMKCRYVIGTKETWILTCTAEGGRSW